MTAGVEAGPDLEDAAGTLGAAEASAGDLPLAQIVAVDELPGAKPEKYQVTLLVSLARVGCGSTASVVAVTGTVAVSVAGDVDVKSCAVSVTVCCPGSVRIGIGAFVCTRMSPAGLAVVVVSTEPSLLVIST